MVAGVQLNVLLDGIDVVNVCVPDMLINNAVIDSRKVKQKDVFVATKGGTTNGIRYIDSAEKNGASAILVDSSIAEQALNASVPVIRVNQLKNQLAQIADNCYANPSASMTLIAVTGTNGKTTCAHLIAQAMKALSVSTAVVGTAGQGVTGDLVQTSLTTPDIFELRKLLAQFKTQNIEAVAFEASSHGIEQGRLDGLCIDLAVFTNLSHDHLDYHGDLNSYARAKLKLFQFPSLACAVMNADYPLVEDFVEQTTATKIWFYGKAKSADVCLVKSAILQHGLKLIVKTKTGEFEFTTELVGKINIENLVAVFTTLLAYGYDEKNICEIMPLLKSVPGRMEVFGGANSVPMVVVDYAHTPDALEKVLDSLKDHLKGKLYCVFGCGGDRDKEKRPKMGLASEKYADVSVITDDNPRHENSKDIIADILAGMSGQPKVITGRADAVKWAIHQASKDDIVLIAGKGHETTQQVGNQYIAMSDQVLVSRTLEELQ